ncbi:hypothetical protein FRB97_002130 [Tulasnella sp. 331]|nr:hypothetical protein FRB97_002130 [Tulasnella sp. 331]
MPQPQPTGALQLCVETDRSGTQVARIVAANSSSVVTLLPGVDETESRLSVPLTPLSVAPPASHAGQEGTQVACSHTNSFASRATPEPCNSDMDSILLRPVNMSSIDAAVDPTVSAPPAETCDLTCTPTAPLTASLHPRASTPVMDTPALPEMGAATPSIPVASPDIAPILTCDPPSTSSLGASATPTLHEAISLKPRELDTSQPTKFLHPPTRPNSPASALSPPPLEATPTIDQVSVSIGSKPRARGSFSSIASRRSASIPPVSIADQPSPPSEPPFPTRDTTVNPIPLAPTRNDDPVKEDQPIGNGESSEKPRRPFPIVPPTQEEAGYLWGGWLKKKVAPKVARYVFGVPEFE